MIDLESFWWRFSNLYPQNRIDLPGAKKMVGAMLHSGSIADEAAVLDGLTRWVAFWNARGVSAPLMSDWLKRHRWKEHPPQAPPSDMTPQQVLARKVKPLQ